MQAENFKIRILMIQECLKSAARAVALLLRPQHLANQRDQPSILVDGLRYPVGQHGILVTLKRRDASTNEIFGYAIIASAPFEVFPTTELEAQIVIWTRPKIAFVAKISNPRIGAGKVAADLL